MLHAQSQHTVSPADLSVLQLLTQDHHSAAASPPARPHASTSKDALPKPKRGDRRPPVDPLMVAAAASAGPQCVVEPLHLSSPAASRTQSVHRLCMRVRPCDVARTQIEADCRTPRSVLTATRYSAG